MGSEVNISGGSFADGYTSEGLANISGGTFDSSFFVRASSVVNISDGTFDGVLSLDGEANISGGNFNMLQTFLIGVVNISGGNFAPDSISESGGNFNLFGSNFFLDGVSLDGRLTEGQAFTIEDRNVTLTSVLADGSPFSYNLPSAENPAFNPDINLTVTLVSSVPEPGSLTLIGLGSVILLALRRKTCAGDLEVHLGFKMKPINGAR